MTVGMTTCLSVRQTEVRYIKGAHFCSFLFIVLLLRELWLLQMWTNFLNLKSTNLHCWDVYTNVYTMYIQTSSDFRQAVELVFEGFVTTFHKKYLQLSGWVAPGTATGVHGWCPLPTANSYPLFAWGCLCPCKGQGQDYPDIYVLALYSVANESEAAGIYDLRWMLKQIIASDWLYLVSGFYFGFAECHHETYRIKATSNSGMYCCGFHFLLFSSDGLL